MGSRACSPTKNPCPGSSWTLRLQLHHRRRPCSPPCLDQLLRSTTACSLQSPIWLAISQRPAACESKFSATDHPSSRAACPTLLCNSSTIVNLGRIAHCLPIMAMSASQIKALEICTRVTSVFSVLGSTFIIFTFLRWPFFRKPINRLVFYATWGNLMANIATLMSRSPIPKGNSGLTSLCEFQGVLIQWFMMADSLWVCLH